MSDLETRLRPPAANLLSARDRYLLPNDFAAAEAFGRNLPVVRPNSSDGQERVEPVAARPRSSGTTRKTNTALQPLKETKMNWDQIEGKWKQYKGKAKEAWGDITDDEFDRVAGKRDQMVGLVQEKYGKAKNDAEREVDAWFAKL